MSATNPNRLNDLAFIINLSFSSHINYINNFNEHKNNNNNNDTAPKDQIKTIGSIEEVCDYLEC